jgi:hypothetical protein
MGHETCGDYGGTNREGDPCGQPAGYGTDFDEGKCKHHRGTSSDGSSHEGNDWAATHGAYSESFVKDFLTEKEIKRVEQAREVLETPEGAQADARLMAAIAKEQFRRTGDERFLRRYESICDTFGIAPADELEVSGELSGELTGEVAVNITHHRVTEDDVDQE